MEGDVMKLGSILILFGLTAMLAGCSKGMPQPHARESSAKADKNSTVEQNTKAIELSAQQAKRNIDAIAAEAEDELRKTHQAPPTTAARPKQDPARARELAAEALEDAKDRAEDLPESTDRVLERQAQRLRDDINRLDDALEVDSSDQKQDSRR
jgi:hypothetical protein